jgi:hypothetical protein
VNFDVTIEIPTGQRNKYEMDHETGRIGPDRERQPGKAAEAARWVGAWEALAETEDRRKRLAQSGSGHP